MTLKKLLNKKMSSKLKADEAKLVGKTAEATCVKLLRTLELATSAALTSATLTMVSPSVCLSQKEFNFPSMPKSQESNYHP